MFITTCSASTFQISLPYVFCKHTLIMAYSHILQYDAAFKPQASVCRSVIKHHTYSPYHKQLHLLNKLEGKSAILLSD